MVLVVGGTGELGGRVVRHLRRADQPVRCMVRLGTDDRWLRDLGVATVTGDLADPDSLAGICREGEPVIATATAIARILAGARRPTILEVDQVGMLRLVEVAELSHAGRFVYVSFAGVDSALGTPLERAKRAVEGRLGTSTLERVIVRPDAFQDIHLAALGRFDVAAGKVAVFGRGDSKRRWVSTDDVAALTARVAVEPHPPPVLEFGGPEALTRNEAIKVAEEAAGRPFRRQRMPRPVARAGIRVLGRRRDALASVFGAGLLQDLVPATWDDSALTERGISPRPASAFIREQVRESAERSSSTPPG